MTPGANVADISPPSFSGEAENRAQGARDPCLLEAPCPLQKPRGGESSCHLLHVTAPPGATASRPGNSSSLISGLGTALLAGSGLPRISCPSPRGF